MLYCGLLHLCYLTITNLIVDMKSLFSFIRPIFRTKIWGIALALLLQHGRQQVSRLLLLPDLNKLSGRGPSANWPSMKLILNNFVKMQQLCHAANRPGSLYCQCFCFCCNIRNWVLMGYKHWLKATSLYSLGNTALSMVAFIAFCLVLVDLIYYDCKILMSLWLIFFWTYKFFPFPFTQYLSSWELHKQLFIIFWMNLNFLSASNAL